MPDEYSEKIVRLLEEIRDLTHLRNEKLEAMVQENRKRGEDQARRYDEALQRQQQAQERADSNGCGECHGVGF